MAKVVLNNNLERIVQEWLVANAQAALVDYTEQPLELDAADYPFERHPGERSIRDPDSQSITPSPVGGITITIEARGAEFIEFGNDEASDRIQGGENGLHIPIKAGSQGRFSGQRIESYGGRIFLVKTFVNAYEGTNRLRDAVRRVFKSVGA